MSDNKDFLASLGKRTISLKAAKKDTFVPQMPADQKAAIIKTLENKGAAFEIVYKKNVIAIYAFEYQKDYISMPEVLDIYPDVTDKELRIFRRNFKYLELGGNIFTAKYIVDEYINMEQDLDKMAREYSVYFYSRSPWAIQMNGKLFGRQAPKKTSGLSWGYLAGFAIGFLIFGVAMHSWYLGICMGMAMGLCLGPSFSGASSDVVWKEYEISEESKNEIIKEACYDMCGKPKGAKIDATAK